MGTSFNGYAVVILTMALITAQASSDDSGAATDATSASTVGSLSIGDFVWEDDNGDGIQDAGEAGVAFITVELRAGSGDLIATALTDASGRYNFSGVPAGAHYFLRVADVPPLSLSPSNAGTDGERDSDFSPTSGGTSTFVLAFPSDATGWDAGLLPRIIGDWVWFDVNEDGVQDSGEIGAPGVLVELYDAQGTVLSTATTDPIGHYRFVGVDPEAGVTLRFVPPPRFWFSPPRTAGDDRLDSDAEWATGRTVSIRPRDEGGDTARWDAGLVGTDVTGQVWVDSDGDGIQGESENTLGGVTVDVIGPFGFIARNVSDESGRYRFAGLPLSLVREYHIRFHSQPRLVFSPQDVAPDEAHDSDVDQNGETPDFILGDPAAPRTWNAGVISVDSVINGRVWGDDGDGVQASDEIGLAGVTVRWMSLEQELLDTVVTQESGLYQFADADVQAPFFLEFMPPSNFIPTYRGRGDSTTDSEIDRLTLRTPVITTELEAFVVSRDAGFIDTDHAIGDRIWQDLDGDGIQSEAEPGVAGLTVWLDRSVDGGFETRITEADGTYIFGNLGRGSRYSIRITAPPETHISRPDLGEDDRTDSDADRVSGETPEIILGDPDDFERWDIGVTNARTAVGDFVWNDLDGNGVQDSGEPGLRGVRLVLVDESGQTLATQRSDGDGHYLFASLFVGDRALLRIEPPTGFHLSPSDQGVDDQRDSDADPRTNATKLFTLDSQTDLLRFDFGLRDMRAVIGDQVWSDSDGNGTMGAREPGVVGVTVRLFTSSGGFVNERLTNATGRYSFGELLQTVAYRIQVIPPSGRIFTSQNQGGDDSVDSDVDPQGISPAFQPSESLDAVRWDAGLIPDCPFPVRTVEVIETRREVDGTSTFVFADPNPIAVVTGYNVYRSADPRTQSSLWPQIASAVRGLDWTDSSNDASPTGIWFYLIAAHNVDCDAEGPR